MLMVAFKFMRMHECTFSCEQLFEHKTLASFNDLVRELKWRIESDASFADVGLSKPWEHWTSTHRLTVHEMIPTNSFHVKQIPLGKCSMTRDGADYEFDYCQTFVLHRIGAQR
jgi:hypothetical protein